MIDMSFVAEYGDLTDVTHAALCFEQFGVIPASVDGARLFAYTPRRSSSVDVNIRVAVSLPAGIMKVTHSPSNFALSVASFYFALSFSSSGFGQSERVAILLFSISMRSAVSIHDSA